MKTKIIYMILIVISTLIGFFAGRITPGPQTKLEQEVQKIIDKPHEKYTIENLSKTEILKSEIKIGETLKETPEYTSHIFSMKINPNLDGKTMKKLTGVINLPAESPERQVEGSPVILMIRGYVNPELYSPGVGTRRSAEEFAKAGFITVAPDFLGYAGSDENAGDIMESRFQTYTTALSALFSIDTLPQWDKQNIYIWAHSNGGTIALTLLEVTGAEFPTTLWAPVSKPFPYSVLYYTDESEDKGKFLRREIATFESLYDSSKYSIDEYWDRIKAPLQLHQGTADDAIPVEWSNNLATILKKQGVDVTYFVYPGSDHNLSPAWDSVVARDIEFFKKHLK